MRAAPPCRALVPRDRSRARRRTPAAGVQLRDQLAAAHLGRGGEPTVLELARCLRNHTGGCRHDLADEALERGRGAPARQIAAVQGSATVFLALGRPPTSLAPVRARG